MHFIVVKMKSLLSMVAILVVICLLAINVNGNAAASVYFGYSLRKIPIYNVKTDEKVVAISFDAAWGADKTEKIMEILKEYNAGATFFLVGFWVENYPEIAKKIAENGFEIGTHSNTHPDMAKLNAEQIKLELETSVKTIEDATNTKVELFRAPFGSYNDTLINTSEELGLTTIQWDVDSLDWKGISAVDITTRILNKVFNGSIILCHNNSDHILEALPMILDRLQKRGYKVKCIGDIIYKDNYTINHEGTQIKNN
ncbi:MAG: deacetylase [Clostridiales bacterium]|nr:deacetylase [Clostridiales bacterium]